MNELLIQLTFGIFFVTAVTMAAVTINTLWISLVLGGIFWRWADDKHPVESQTKVETGPRRQPTLPVDQEVDEDIVRAMMKEQEWQHLFNP